MHAVQLVQLMQSRCPARLAHSPLTLASRSSLLTACVCWQPQWWSFMYYLVRNPWPVASWLHCRHKASCNGLFSSSYDYAPSFMLGVCKPAPKAWSDAAAMASTLLLQPRSSRCCACEMLA